MTKHTLLEEHDADSPWITNISRQSKVKRGLIIGSTVLLLFLGVVLMFFFIGNVVRWQ